MATSEPAPAAPLFHVLAFGDAVVPSVLHCTQRIPVPGAEGALPPPTAPTAAQCRAACERPDPPTWMSPLPAYVVAELGALLAGLGPFGATARYAFDPFHRLDDRTFLGEPVGTRVPVLGVRLGDDLLGDATGASIALHLRKFAGGDAAYRDAFSVELRELASFGAPWSADVHVPALLLEERYRLVSLETETTVGALAGTLTLVPGERRTIRIGTSSERKATGRSSRSVVEDVDVQTKDDFTAEFARNGKSTRAAASRVTWTVVPPGKDLPSPHVREQSWSVEELVDLTEETVRQTTQTRKASTKVTISRDDERVDTDKVEDARTVDLWNPSAQCLTLAYHHLNTAYRTHFDLAGLRLVYTGADAAAGPVSLPLAGELGASLRGVLGEEVAIARLEAVVGALLHARYGALGIGRLAGERYVLEAPSDDDPNDRLDSRAALLGPRRRTGALPLCLSTRTHVVQRDTLHAIPHLSEYGIPDATIPRPKGPGPGVGVGPA